MARDPVAGFTEKEKCNLASHMIMGNMHRYRWNEAYHNGTCTVNFKTNVTQQKHCRFHFRAGD